MVVNICDKLSFFTSSKDLALAKRSQLGNESMILRPDPVPTGCNAYTEPNTPGYFMPKRIAPYPPIKSPAMPREFRLGKVLKFVSMYGTSSWIMKSSQFPVTGEFTYQELPRGVVMSTETRMNWSITPAAIARSKRPWAFLLSNGTR